jgi:uncharacterized protein YutE (UPF0331/DUF86 family)
MDMAPEVIRRKLSLLITYLDDLRKYLNLDFDEYMENHYAIERILELLVITATDMLFHLLTERGEAEVTTYSATFRRAGEIGILDATLAERLAKLAGLRNILVHGYESVDHQIIHKSIHPAIDDFTSFAKHMNGLASESERYNSGE